MDVLAATDMGQRGYFGGIGHDDDMGRRARGAAGDEIAPDPAEHHHLVGMFEHVLDAAAEPGMIVVPEILVFGAVQVQHIGNAQQRARIRR